VIILIKETKTIKKVAIYSRKSRPEETEETLQKQVNFLIEICVKNNWEYEVFQEIASSQDDNRPELNKMLDKVQAFHYDAILITDQDRLSRNTGGFARIKDILIEFNVLVITSSKVYDYSTQEDDLMSDMQSIVAKQEYINTKKRLVRGSRQSAKQGNWAAGSTPYGYNYDHKSKKLVPNEDSETVKTMFKLYIGGLSTRDIAAKLNLEGRLTLHGKHWTSSVVSRLMNNPVYKGMIVYNKTKRKKNKTIKNDESEHIIVPDAHKAIISEDDWETVQSIKKKRAVTPPALRFSKKAFSGLIKCHKCGKSHSIDKRVGDSVLIIGSCKTREYENNDYKKYKMCGNMGGRLDYFEALFYKAFSRYIVKLEDYIELINKNIVILEDDTEKEISRLEGLKSKINEQISKVQDGLLNEIFTKDEAKIKISRLREQLTLLSKEISKLANTKSDDKIITIDNTLRIMRSILSNKDSMPEAELNKLLVSVIDCVIYEKNGGFKSEMKIKIIYKGQQI
jgi:DNA invertase Pin-like site-specific DNA recombinase